MSPNRKDWATVLGNEYSRNCVVYKQKEIAFGWVLAQERNAHMRREGFNGPNMMLNKSIKAIKKHFWEHISEVGNSPWRRPDKVVIKQLKIQLM